MCMKTYLSIERYVRALTQYGGAIFKTKIPCKGIFTASENDTIRFKIGIAFAFSSSCLNQGLNKLKHYCIFYLSDGG